MFVKTRIGDVANKIGTYKLAVCGKENGVAVYACVPTPTIDLETATGRDITIEERNPSEVSNCTNYYYLFFGKIPRFYVIRCT